VPFADIPAGENGYRNAGTLQDAVNIKRLSVTVVTETKILNSRLEAPAKEFPSRITNHELLTDH